MLTRERNKISYIHFILSVLVILIHSINNDEIIEKIFSIDTGIGQFAPPLFFIISGFLFFVNIKDDVDVKNKLRNRVKSLLIPFLVWNVIYYIINMIVKPGDKFLVSELIMAAINYKYNPAFWFMYQLILLTIISPAMYLLLKNDKNSIIFLIAVCIFIATNMDFPFINEDAIIYYFSGAYFSKLYNKNKVSFISKKNIIYAVTFAILFFFINRIMYSLVSKSLDYLYYYTLSIVIMRLSFSFAIFYIIDLFFRYDKVPKFMVNTFMLYAIHYMIVKGMIVIMKYLSYKYAPGEYYVPIQIFTFFISPIVCIIINYYFVKLLSKKFPNAYKVLSGNR